MQFDCTWAKRSRESTRSWTAGVIFLSILLLAAMSPKERGVHRSVTWKSTQDNTAQGLWLLSLAERGFVNRLLIEGPSGQLALLTKIVDAGHGTQSTRYEDLASGWWIELKQSYGVEWPNYRIALRSLAAGPDSPNMDGSVQITLQTSHGFDFRESYPRRLGGEIPDLIGSLGDGQQKVRLGRAIPATSAEIFRLLVGSLEAGQDPTRLIGGEYGDLLDVVEWASEGHPKAKGQEEAWPLPEVGAYQVGTLTDPELIELVAKFPDLDNVDPLAGTRPTDLFE